MSNISSNLIFTEDLDYSKTGITSIWGEGDLDTLESLNKLVKGNKITGRWLNFAAGDGRYNDILLNEVDELTATDVDISALNKLRANAPKKLTHKLVLKEQNITKNFPFKDGYFDGVFNTGTLHLFHESVLNHVFQQTNRVLKDGGIFIFDFATDIKRVREDGILVARSGIEYNKIQAKEMLVGILNNNGFMPDFTECSVPPEEVTTGDGSYLFSCNYWLVFAYKKP